jgi:hypothetical protein
MKNQTFISLLLLLIVGPLLTSCGSDSGEQITGVPLSGKARGEDGADRKGNIPVAIDTGLTTVIPTMANLQGKPQEFPVKYPVVRYPNSAVKLVRIERMLYPGWKNQVMLQSDDTQESINEFYSLKLGTEGWTKVSDYRNMAFSSTVWQKDGQEVEIRVSPDPHNNKNIQLFCGPLQRRDKKSAKT